MSSIITLAKYQSEAIESLMQKINDVKGHSNGTCCDITLKSCTGSGKTIILTHLMQRYIQEYPDSVFVWLTPGTGGLAEQSKEKMDRYIHLSHTKLLDDVMISGFEKGDAVFINWEKLTKKGNVALRDGEHKNFKEYIEAAKNDGISFYIIVDESHHNDTVASADIIDCFGPRAIIKTSATPKNDASLKVEVREEDVIDAGLIKRLIAINEDFPANIETSDKEVYLLDMAIAKREALHCALKKKDSDVNPLIIIQIPDLNKDKGMEERIKNIMEKRGFDYDNNRLAIWLSNSKKNVDGIKENNAKPCAVIIKQAIATGWDCPRAYILVKLRCNMEDNFEIQSVGRIRRMPEARRYNDSLLDTCYLYTFDTKFSEGTKQNMDTASEVITLRLKDLYKSCGLSLESEKHSVDEKPVAAEDVKKVLKEHYADKYKIQDGDDIQSIERKLLSYHYVFGNVKPSTFKSGNTSILSVENISKINSFNLQEDLTVPKLERDKDKCVKEIASVAGIKKEAMQSILLKLFAERQFNMGENPLLELPIPGYYYFIINNIEKLKEDVREAMAKTNKNAEQAEALLEKYTFPKYTFPLEYMLSYNASSKSKELMPKNIYEGYLSSAYPRSDSEKKLERFCENDSSVKWWCKNGDKGEQFFSIAYKDNFGKTRLFYPDYIVGTNYDVSKGVWIIETKGGWDTSHTSLDIDSMTGHKAEALSLYITRQRKAGKDLSWGFVRYDEDSCYLYICKDNYSDDINSECWHKINEILSV